MLDPHEPIQEFYEGGVCRLKIGDLGTEDYGLEILDHGANSIMKLDGSGVNTLCGWSIDSTKFYKANTLISSSGYISFGATPPTAYGNNVGAWLGYSSGAKISLYADASNFFQWDASKLLVKAANFELDASGNITAASAEFTTGTIKECEIQVYISGVLKTNADPASNGGLFINNTSITGYNTSGDIRFQSIFSGANQGDLLIGDYAGNKGCFYDQSAGTFSIRGALNADDLSAGTITSRTLQTAASPNERIVISQSDNHIHFYGDEDGVGTIAELSNIGFKNYGGDNVIGYFGNTNSVHIGVCGVSDSQYGVYGVSSSGIGVGGFAATNVGVYGNSTDESGVYGLSTNSHGGIFAPSLQVGSSNTLVINPIGGDMLMKSYQNDSFPDNSVVELTDATDGMVFVSCNGESGMWLVESDGTVTKVAGTANTADTESDTDLCVFDNGTNARVKNMLGVEGKIRIVHFYN